MIAATRPWAGPPVTVTGREPEMDWRQRAACRDAADPELWFSTAFYPQQEAKAICQQCPAVAECLEDGLAAEDTWSIRGGLTPDERRQQFGPLARCATCGNPFSRRDADGRVAPGMKHCPACREARGAQRQRKAVA